MSLVGLLTLSSCSPPAKNNLSPSQVASPDIKHAPYLLKPISKGSDTPLFLRGRSPVSPEVEAKLRAKYGNNIVSMYDDPVYHNYRAKLNGENPTPLTLLPPSFQALSHSYATSVSGCLGGNYFQGATFLSQVGCFDSEDHVGDWGWVDNCYQSGGTPYYHVTEHCELAGESQCARVTYRMAPVECVRQGSGGGDENPDNDNCEGKCDGAGAAPFDLLMVHNNLPPNGLKPPGDDVQSQVTISPADVNDAYDSARLVINDRENKGWKLELFKPNGKLLYEESGLGNSVAGWDGLDENLALNNGMYRAKLTQIENPSIVLERNIRVDNEKPVVNNIRVQEDARTNSYTVKATLKEAGNGTFQSGVNPAKTKLFFDDGVNRDDANKTYNADTGEYSVTFSDLAQYRIAKQQSQQFKGYDFPFELQIADYAGNETSNRGSGPDGPLRIQVADPYFSPNGDGVKDSLNFKVIAETSEAYSVQVKRNGATVKSWTGLIGEQNLSWDGKQNGQALADGNYWIVAMTEKQRDRVRDAQIVVLDNSPPEISYDYTPRKDGKNNLKVIIEDKESGVDNSSIQVIAQNNWVLSPAVQVEKSEKRTVLKLTAEEPVFPLPTTESGGFSTLQVAPEDPTQNTNFQIAGNITAQNKSKVAPAKKEIQVNLTRIPLSGKCSLVTRTGNSADSIKAVFDLDSRNKDITLLIESNVIFGGKREDRYKFNSTIQINSPVGLTTLDADGNYNNKSWFADPVYHLKRFSLNLANDSESGMLPQLCSDLNFYDFESSIPKTCNKIISAYDHAMNRVSENEATIELKNQAINNLKTQIPTIEGIEKIFERSDYYYLALDTSKLADKIGNNGGNSLITIMFNQNYGINLNLKLGKGKNKWEKITCSGIN